MEPLTWPTDRCPACGQGFYPGLSSRRCLDCKKPICSGCRRKYNNVCLCKTCHNKRTVDGSKA